MTLRDQIIAEALSWEGTPYHHHACLKHVGVDCIHLIVGIAKAVGVLDASYGPPIYSQQWHLHNTHELLREGILACGGTLTAHPESGDILLFRFALAASHAAILLPGEFIIHAVLNKKVTRQRYTMSWQKIFDSAYCFPGVRA